LEKTRKELEKMERKSMEKKSTREKKDNIGNNQGRRRNQVGKFRNKRVDGR